MPEHLSADQVNRIAGLELNALLSAGVLPAQIFERTRVPSAGTIVHDVNGEVLFHRIPVVRGQRQVGYADIAANPALAAPMLAVSHGVQWNEAAIRKEAVEASRKREPRLDYDRIRFVAFSYPKLGIQFLKGTEEKLLLEWRTWEIVPPARRVDRQALQPSNFERWSLLDELPAGRKRTNARAFQVRLRLWDNPKIRRLDPSVVSLKTLKPLAIRVRLFDSQELHFSNRETDHHPCYEVEGQETNVWCVAASVQMLLDFYRYEYTQVHLAQELGLGTLTNPSGLPYARVQDVVTSIEHLTSNALDATMVTNPVWSVFRDEIRQNRPLISFIPGHSRTVAGYTRTVVYLSGGLWQFRGLLVYDPWPPNAGVITRWENFDAQTYQYAYTGVVTLV